MALDLQRQLYLHRREDNDAGGWQGYYLQQPLPAAEEPRECLRGSAGCQGSLSQPGPAHGGQPDLGYLWRRPGDGGWIRLLYAQRLCRIQGLQVAEGFCGCEEY